MNEIKQLIKEGVKEKALEDFIRQTIQGTEWQDHKFTHKSQRENQVDWRQEEWLSRFRGE